MKVCEHCFGLGWKERSHQEADGGEIRLEWCTHHAASAPLWLVDVFRHDEAEKNLQVWSDAVILLEALADTFDHPERREGRLTEGVGIAIVDGLQRAKVERDHAENVLEMRRVYAEYKANR